MNQRLKRLHSFHSDRRQLVGVQRRERHHHDERQEGSAGGHREAFREGGVFDEAREGHQPAARRQRSGLISSINNVIF